MNGSLTGTGAGTVRFGAGTLTAGVNATLNFPAGLFSWGGDANLSGGTWTNLGTIQITDSDPNLNTKLINPGIIIQGNAYLDFTTGGEVHVLNGGIFDIANTGSGYQFRNFGGAGVFVESGGTLRHSGSGYFQTNGVPINVTGGTVEITDSYIQFNSGGSLTNAIFSVAAGKTFYLDGTSQTVNGSLTGTGAGTVRFGAGTLTAGVNATLNFPAGLFSWGGDANLSGGTWTNTGTIQIADGDPNLNTLLLNKGTITQGNAYLDFTSATAELRVQDGGLFRIMNSANGYQFRNFAGLGITVEAGGIFRHSDNGQFFTGGVPFSNLGTVEVESGTLTLSAVAQISGTALTGGTWDVAAGATLDLSSPTLTTNAGTIRLHGNANFVGLGTTLSQNSGTLEFLDGASRGFTANFTNSGLIRIGVSTTLTASAGFTNTATGEVLFVIGGIPAGGAFGKLNISGAATLAGTAGVELANGYGPLTGQQFTLMTFASHTGAFTAYDQPRIGRESAFDPVLTATNLVFTALVDASDLDPTSVTFGPSGVAGQNFTINYTVQNTSDAITLASSWTDSLYLSFDGTFDAGDKLIGRVTHAGALAGHSSYNGSLTAPLPGAVDGNYHIIIVADSRGNVPDRDRTNNAGASAGVFALTLPALTAGVAFNGTIAAGQDAWFRVDLPPGQTPNFHAIYALPGEAELYIQQYDLPTLATFDAKDFSVSKASADITRYSGINSTFYVLLHGREAAGAGANFSLTAKGLPFGATEARTNHGSDLGSVTTVVHGSLFTSATTFSLFSGGTVDPASSVTFVDPATAWVTFDLRGLALGSYDLRASDGAAQATLPGAFTVNHGRAGAFNFDLTVPYYIRPPFRGTIAVLDYTNTGETDIPAQLVSIVSDNAKFRFSTSESFTDDVVQVLAISSDGPAGVLAPGAHGRIEILYEPKVVGPHFLSHFQSYAEGSETTVIDWASFKSALRPSTLATDAWDATYANFTTQVGTTQATYRDALAADATHLSLLGQRTFRADALLAYEFQKADNFGEISSRYALGSFGRGQTSVLQEFVTIDADGNAALREGNAFRGFVHQLDGSFKGLVGDTASLTRDNAGAFTLHENDGSVHHYRASDGRLDYTLSITGRRVDVGYDVGNHVTSLTQDNGDTTSFSYNAQGRVSQLTDAVGRTSSFSYEASGNLLSFTDAGGGTVSYTYVSGQGAAREHAVASITFADGTQRFFEYDTHGRLSAVQATMGGALRTSYVYDDLGKVTTTDPTGAVTLFYLDVSGNIARTIDASGHIFTTNYTTTGLVTSQTTGNGNVQQIHYAANGTFSGYKDALGQLTQVAISGGTQRVQSITDPRGLATDFTYDAGGKLLTQTTPDGDESTRTYDAMGRLSTVVDEDGRLCRYTYDSHELLTRKDQPNGSHLDYTYDAHRNLLTATQVSGGVSLTTTFTYNSADRLTSVMYPNGEVLSYTYDSAGRVSTTTDQTGFVQRYEYNALSQLARVADTSNTTIVAYSYDAAGRTSVETHGDSSTTTTTYTATGKTASITHRAPNATTIESLTYTYDAAGHLATALSGAGLTTYGYDAAGQLTSVALPGGGTVAYQYSAGGYRTAVVTNGTPTNYATNTGGEITSAGTSTFTYDRHGDLISSTTGGSTTSYLYNDDYRLASIVTSTGTTSYEYDALGTRIAEVRDGIRTQLLADPLAQGRLFAEFSSGGQSIAHYSGGGGLAARISASGAAYYLYDVTGNTLALEAAGTVLNHYTYLPFGEKTASTETVENRFTYTGRYGVQDSGGGLYTTANRTYSATLGRFLQQDPISFRSGETNLYRYAGNAPLQRVDPSGLDDIFVSGNLDAIAGLGVTGSVSPFYNTEGGIGDSGVGLTFGVGAGVSAGPSVTVGSATDISGVFVNVEATGPLVGAGLYTDGHGNNVGGGVNFGTPSAAVKATYTVKLTPNNLGVALGLKEYKEPGFNDRGGFTDPNWNKGARDIIKKPSFQQTLKDINAKRPPDANDLNRAATHEGNIAREEQWKHDYREWLLHDGRPSTEPPVPNFIIKGSETITPHDPNNLLAPRGFGADALSDVATQSVRFDGFTGLGADYGYSILFENQPTAGAPAQVVAITQTLDSNLDFSTFVFGSFGWGNTNVSASNGTGTSFHQRVDQRANLGIDVDVDATLNTITGALSVTFTSIDPATGDIPIDPFKGLLPPNIINGQGDGYVTYAVQPKVGIASGTNINAQASIVFDTEAAISTPAVHNTIDSIAPTSAITSFAGGAASTTSRTNFAVHWTGSDELGGSGLHDISILYRDNDGPLTPLVFNTAATAAGFAGTVGHTYKFFSAASDNAGNTETVAALPDATITVVAPTFISNKNPNGKLHVFTDEDGDTYTIAVTGPGTLTAVLLDPNANGKGSLDQIFLTGSTTKTKVTVAVKRKGDGPDADKLPDGDGIVTIGDLNVTGAIAAFTAKSSDIIVDGVIASGVIGAISVRDMIAADAFAGIPGVKSVGTALTKTKFSLLARNIGDGTFNIGNPAAFIKAASIGDGLITAPSLGLLSTSAGAMDADMTIAGAVGPVTIKGSVNLTQWTVSRIGAVVIGGGISGDIDATGKVGAVTIKNGALNGQITGTNIGPVKISGGDLGGFIGSSAPVGKVKGLASLTITGGSLTGSVTVTGNAGVITVKENKHGIGGAISGEITARSIAGVTLVGGNFTGSITATGTAVALNKVAALGKLAVTGGNLIGDVSLLGALGTVSVKANKAGIGGSIQGAQITASKIAALLVAKDVSNSLILAGASLGANGVLGGGDDTFAASTIGAVSIGRDVIASTIAAGLSTTNATLKDNDDTLLGITPTITSKIASLIVKGSADAASYFATGKFSAKPKIGAIFPVVTTDVRFKVA